MSLTKGKSEIEFALVYKNSLDLTLHYPRAHLLSMSRGRGGARSLPVSNRVVRRVSSVAPAAINDADDDDNDDDDNDDSDNSNDDESTLTVDNARGGDSDVESQRGRRGRGQRSGRGRGRGRGRAAVADSAVAATVTSHRTSK